MRFCPRGVLATFTSLNIHGISHTINETLASRLNRIEVKDGEQYIIMQYRSTFHLQAILLVRTAYTKRRAIEQCPNPIFLVLANDLCYV